MIVTTVRVVFIFTVKTVLVKPLRRGILLGSAAVALLMAVCKNWSGQWQKA